MQLLKGLAIDVYRCADSVDTTAGGPSKRHNRFIMFGLHVPQVHEATPDIPGIVLTYWDGYPRLTPVSLQRYRPAFGGNFGWTSDSRWREIMEASGLWGNMGPVKIFDHIVKLR